MSTANSRLLFGSLIPIFGNRSAKKLRERLGREVEHRGNLKIMFHYRVALEGLACTFLASVFIIPCIKLFSIGSRVLDLQTKSEQFRDQIASASRQLEEIVSIPARAKALDQAYLMGLFRTWGSPSAAGTS